MTQKKVLIIGAVLLIIFGLVILAFFIGRTGPENKAGSNQLAQKESVNNSESRTADAPVDQPGYAWDSAKFLKELILASQATAQKTDVPKAEEKPRFSDTFLALFPDAPDRLAKENAHGKLRFLQQVLSKNNKDKYPDRIAHNDLVIIVADIFSSQSDLTLREKSFLAGIVRGEYFFLSPYLGTEFEEWPDGIPPEFPDEEDILVNGWSRDDGWWKPLPKIIPHLTKLLNDPDKFTRKHSLSILGELDAKESAPEIIKLLGDSDATIRTEAIKILGRWGVKEPVNTLLLLLSDADEYVRGQSARTLLQIGPLDVIPDLLRILADPKATGIIETIWLLGQSGVAEIVPDLLRLLNEPQDNPYIYVVAIYSLGELKASQTKYEIKRFLDAKYLGVVRLNAVNTLARFDAREYVPDIIEALKNLDKSRRIFMNKPIEDAWYGVALVELGAKDSVAPELAEKMKSILKISYSITPGLINKWTADQERIKRALNELGVDIKEEKK